MKLYVFLIGLCFIQISLFAQRGNEQRYDSKMDIALMIEDKDPHNLFVGCKEGECDLFWNDQLLMTAHSFNAAVDFLIPIKSEDYPNLFLIPIYQGDGCPSQYKILQIVDKKTHWLTDTFGNCNEPTFTIKKKLMTFQFEGLNEADLPTRRKSTYTYHLKKGELLEVK